MPKKKSALNKPQRGFATTSILKKKEDVEPAPEPAQSEPVALQQEPSANKDVSRKDGSSNGAAADGLDSATAGNWDDSEAFKANEERLALSERVRAASEKEASKTLKVIEYEKRVAANYAEFNWDDSADLRDRILALALTESATAPPTGLEESIEKLLIRIAGLYLILRRLHFTAPQVQECLGVVHALELEEALKWIYLRYSPKPSHHIANEEGETVQPYGLGHWPDISLAIPEATPNKPTPKPVVSAIVPSSPITAPHTQEPVKEIPKSSLFAYRNPDSDDSSDEDTSGPSKTASTTTTPSAAISEDDEDLEDDPDGAYVRTKLRVTSLQRKLGLAGKSGGKKGKGKPAKPVIAANKAKTPQELELEKLEEKLKQIQGLYLFNAKKAEAVFMVERSKLDKAELAERLAGKAKERESRPVKPEDETATPAEKPPHGSGKEIGELGSSGNAETTGPVAEESLFGDMLEHPDEAPASESASGSGPLLNEHGSIVTVRDMSLPKKYTGKTPRTLLDEAVHRIDRYAKVTYRVLSRNSRAVRAVVTLRFESGKVQQFGMDDEACENQDQAFQYAAALALFAITPANDSSAAKFLPAVFRDFWDELERKRRQKETEVYEKQMQIYQDLAAARRENAESRPPSDQPVQLNPPSSANDHRSAKATSGTASFARPSMMLQEQLRVRQSMPSYQDMLAVRQSLPISGYCDQIVSTIENNQVTVLCGETGCGKSTQTPTMILESELSKGKHVKIYCTEPRRISAISLAQRVSQELGESLGSLGSKNSYIGYNIRLEARVSSATRLTYATTGILLRMLEGDTELEDVTHIIIDEVHERSIDSDFLLIILKSLLRRRKNLRILLMSATVDADKISFYMGGCPVINVPGRTFPVTPYFLEDAVELSQYRLELDSDSPYVQKMQRKPHRQVILDEPADEGSDEEAAGHSQFRSGYSKQTQTTLEAMNEHMINFDLVISLLETICFNSPDLQPFSQAILVFLPSLETIRKLCDLLESHPGFGSTRFAVFPLHSSISNEQQSRVFNIPPRGVRKIVVSTNIAETGVTIPDITAVIDSGRHKEMRFDEKRQISRLIECWIARSNALQRRGRAGRVQEGICFHLFTKARLETALAEHPLPEMLRLSLQDLALRIKILKFPGSIEDTLSQALDPPLAVNVQRAVASLVEVKALTSSEDITQLGRHLVKLPLDVYTAKLCLLATIFGCLDAALTIAATLNSKSFFVTVFGREAEADTVKRSFKVPDEHSDFLVIYRAYKLWRQNCENGTWSTFCRKHFLSHQNLSQIEELKNQYISNLVEAGFIAKDSHSTVRYPRGPGKLRFSQLDAQLDRFSEDSSMIMSVIAAAMHPKLLYLDGTNSAGYSKGGQWKTLSNNAPVAIHPSSSNFAHGRKPDFGNASFLTFFNIQQSKRLYVWENGVVEQKAVMLLSGEADIKHFANSASVDRKIRRHVERKTGLAIELLRVHLDDILQTRLNNPSKPLSGRQAEWFALIVEALRSPEAPGTGEGLNGEKERSAMSINVVKR